KEPRITQDPSGVLRGNPPKLTKPVSSIDLPWIHDVLDLRTTPDGKRLVVREGTQNDKGLDLHRLLSVDATTGKVQRVLEETNSLFFDRAMLFADQGRTLVIMGPDAKGLLAFDLETGKIEKKYPVDQLT